MDFDKEGIEEIDEQLKALMVVSEKMLPSLARLMKIYYDELTKQGLPEEVVVSIVSNYKMD